MDTRRQILRDAMESTGTTQSRLALFSGVRQPSISQFLSGRIEFSDEQLDRVLSCMGMRLEVRRESAVAEMTHSERRSWLLHRQLATHLSREGWKTWKPVVLENLVAARAGVIGAVHERNVDRWEALVARDDVEGLRSVLTGVDRQSIEMREVSPMKRLLPQGERDEVMALARRA